MPYKRKYRKKTYRKKRRYRRKKKMALLKTPLPTKLTTKLRYTSLISLNPAAAGVPAVHVFSANGIYDPDITAAGHQPRGFDQIMPMYDHFRVTQSKCSVNFSNGNGTYACIGGISVRDDVTAETALQDYTEQANTSWVGLGVANGGNSERTLSKTAKVLKFLDVDSKDSELKGSASSNPGEQVYYHIYAAPYLQSADASSVHCLVTIEYLVHFLEPKDLISS